MTTRLDPPTVQPLDQARRTRLRSELMTRTAPGSGSAHRWAVPALTAAAVAAVLAGSLVAVDHANSSNQDDPPTAGSSDVVKRDLGPASPQQVAAAIKSCMIPHSRPLQTVWSRQVVGTGGPTDTPGTIVLVREPAPRPAGHPPLSFCLAPVPVATGHEESEITKVPTAAQGVLVISRTTDLKAPPPSAGEASPSGRFGRSLGPLDRSSVRIKDNAGAEVGTTLLRVRPGIARLESRYVWNGGVGPWSEGAVADGFGFTQSVVDTGAVRRKQQREEFRAFDAAGNPVPVKL